MRCMFVSACLNSSTKLFGLHMYSESDGGACKHKALPIRLSLLNDETVMNKTKFSFYL